jgi:uncharacterized LabA/DUF88 family protein
LEFCSHCGSYQCPLAKSALFIDGQSLHHAAKALNFEVDYKRLLAEFERRGPLLRAYYYTTVFETEDFTAVRPLLDWLEYNGFTVRTILLREHDDGEGRRRWKRNIGVDLVINAMETAGYVDNVYLFSGDRDFRSLVQALQRRGVFVTVVSTLRSKPAPMVADDRRRQADAFLELERSKAAISR